jgi:putative ABC transport system ATP-binding protein
MLELKDVGKKYKMDHIELEVLKGVNLKIKEGEIVAIIGPSGSGKTTMLNMIGLLDRPTAGKVLIDNDDVSDLGEDDLAKIRRQKIGFIFQFFYLIPSLSSQRNVMLPMSFNGVPRHEQEKRSAKLLNLVGLNNKMDSLPTQLSGGERQRVAIARSLANNPEIVLADEPTGNLDSRTGKEIMKILLRLNREEGVTLVIITHDSDIASCVQRIVHIKDGQIEREEHPKKRNTFGK